MKATALLLTALLVGATLSACATDSSDAPPRIAAAEGEEFQITATVLAVYNVLSGPAGRRDWDRFEALFAPDARIVSTASDGAVASQTPKEFVTVWTPKYNAAASFRRPVATRVLRYGNIAHVWSTYEARDAANQDKASARGVNSFELVRIGNEWKVQSLVSQPEDAAHPIPPAFAAR
ncbi:MAG: DUF4440 domain-containing protein [Acidobacteria bacterium]|nr:DUF4440 domain-containing protein [Acidobacteriota bacterium]